MNWRKYKNVIFLVLGIVAAAFFSTSGAVHGFLLNLGNWGYLGALIGGILFVSSFTSAIGTVILFILSEKLPIAELSIIAGIGGVIGDFTIFKIVKDDLIKELKPLYNKFGGRKVTKFFQKKYVRWLVPVLGAIIIASPFPDELGVSLMGLSGMKARKFLIITFILDIAGIYALISVLSLFRY